MADRCAKWASTIVIHSRRPFSFSLVGLRPLGATAPSLPEHRLRRIALRATQSAAIFSGIRRASHDVRRRRCRGRLGAKRAKHGGGRSPYLTGTKSARAIWSRIVRADLENHLPIQVAHAHVAADVLPISSHVFADGGAKRGREH